eukprot:9503919-Pyramimonas_sp.AAC.2
MSLTSGLTSSWSLPLTTIIGGRIAFLSDKMRWFSKILTVNLLQCPPSPSWSSPDPATAAGARHGHI